MSIVLDNLKKFCTPAKVRDLGISGIVANTHLLNDSG